MKIHAGKFARVTLSWLAMALPCLAAEPTVQAPANTQTNGPDITVEPIVTYVNVHGDKQQFREDMWMNDEWTGGIQSFSLQQKLDKTTTLTMEGRGVFDQQDYKLSLAIVRPEVGFIRAGFTQYRKYYDNTGGYYPLFKTATANNSSFNTKNDLGLDIGNIFVDVGLTLPNFPKLTLGYERQYKVGEKSLLEWGSVTQTVTSPPRPAGSLPTGSVTKKIYPSYEHIDEAVDIIKFGIDHDIKNIHLASDFHYEHYNDATKKVDGSSSFDAAGAPVSSQSVTVKETQSHDNFSNVFHMESWLNEKVFWSAGHLFSTTHGDGTVNLNTVPYSAANDKDWSAKNITLTVDSQVLNLNLLVGPFKNLIAYAGIQAEQTDTTGSGDALLTEFPDAIGTGTAARLRSNQTKGGLEENLGLRFTGIPFTIVYVEGKWTEQDIDLNEKEFDNGTLVGPYAFKRDTETDVFREQYTVGFNSSPLRNVTWSARYRRTERDNDYDNNVDTTDGYSAFIKSQEFDTDEVTTKVTVHPISKLSLSFQYQLVSSEIFNHTDPAVSTGNPGGTVKSGNYDANIYTTTLTVTPISRMYMTSLFSLQDTRTITFDNGSHTVVTYHGDVYTLIQTVGYAIGNNTDVTAEYTYSRADNFQNNGDDKTPKAGSTSDDYGLPLGVSNERMAGSVTLTQKFTQNVVGRLRYGYYQFHESHTGSANNYSAHLASASCAIRF